MWPHSQPWKHLKGKRYVTTHAIAMFSQTIPVGFEFEVSVPNWMRWPINPHDPAWLWAALWHDWYLERGRAKLIASYAMARAMLQSFPPWRWYWIPPAFVATLIYTTLSPPIRRVFSWMEGMD